MPVNLNKTFAENMHIRRKELKITQEKLAEMCGLHRTYIGGIEQGTRNPSLKNVEKICEALKMPAPAATSEDYKLLEDSYAICRLENGVYTFYPVDAGRIPAQQRKMLDDLCEN